MHISRMGAGYSMIALPQWYLEGSKWYGRTGFQRAAATWADRDLQIDMRGKVVICTGANSGLGRHTAEELARRNAEVHMLCRNEQRGETARSEIVRETGNENVHLHVVDVSDGASVTRFADEFNARGTPLHCLINNAGAIPKTHSKTAEGVEMTMAIAMGGSYLLTGRLLPALARDPPSRVINVSSGGMYTAKLDANDLNMEGRKHKFDGTLAYAFAKRAQVVITEQQAEKLAPLGICVHSMHPGWSDTPGVQESIPEFRERQKDELRSIAEGADTILWLAMAPEGGDPARSGHFWFDRAVARTAMPMSGTEPSSADRAKLWAFLEKHYGPFEVPAAPEGATAASAGAAASAE